MPPPERLTIHVRVTPDLLKRLKVAAAENGRSMNAEIDARLDRSFSTDDAARAMAINLLNEAILVLDKGANGK